MAEETVQIPFGDAFGPGQLNFTDGRDESELRVILELIDDNEGDQDAFEKDVKELFFEGRSKNPEGRAENVRFAIGPDHYALVDDDFKFSEIGQELYELRAEPDELQDRFSKYILLEKNGLKLIEAVEDLPALNKEVNMPNILEVLVRQYGVEKTSDTTSNISQMRGWLNKSGIIGTGRNYDIDRAKIEELIGASEDEILEISGLTDEQRAFLKSLALVDPAKPIPHTKIHDIAEAVYGVNISGKRASRYVLEPLEDKGYIEVESKRGAPNVIEQTDKLTTDVLIPLVKHIEDRDGVPRHIIQTSFSELESKLDSSKTHEKGRALEALTAKVGYLLGLEFVDWHLRNWNSTGGSEIDVVMDSTGTSFSRWQIQCKNTARSIRTDDVKEEVGVSELVQSNIILMIARSGIAEDAKKFAARITAKSNISIVFLDGGDLAQYDTHPDKIVNSLRGEIQRVRRHKEIGVGGIRLEEQTESNVDEEDALDEFQEELDDYL